LASFRREIRIPAVARSFKPELALVNSESIDQDNGRSSNDGKPRPGTISVCIVCRNEADRLTPALESVKWADEILVMDLNSTDNSAELAAANGAQVVKREPYPIVEPLRNELAALASSDWILALDPDERITPGLAEELRRAAQQEHLDAVAMPRTNYDLGFAPSAPIHRFEMQLRMYRPARVTWPNIPNALPKVPEDRIYRVAADDRLVMIHDRSRNVHEILDRMIRYTPMQGQSMLDQGKVFSARAMSKAMTRHVRKQILLAKPWEDGVPGLFRAGLLIAFHFFVWMAFWQASGSPRTDTDNRIVRRWGNVLVTLWRLTSPVRKTYSGLRRLIRR
jgi:glycosyltransferase involved in cell wall biosynthesis